MSRNGMQYPLADLYKRQNKKLIPDTFKKGIVVNVYINSRTVDLYFVNNPQTVLKNIICSLQIDMSTIAIGQRCKVDIFSETNARDIVVSYTY